MKKQYKWIWYPIWLLIVLFGGGGTLFSWMPRTPGMFYGGIAMLTVGVGLCQWLMALAMGKPKSWLWGLVSGIAGLAVMGAVTLLCDHVLFPGKHVYASLAVTLLNFNYYLYVIVRLPKSANPGWHMVKRAVALILAAVALILSGFTQNFWWSCERSDLTIGSWKPTQADFAAFTVQEKQPFDEGVFSWKEGDLMVAPDGDDSNPGTQQKPLATLAAAKEKAVAGSTVWFQAGVYLLEEVVVFDETDASSVTYRSVPGEKVVFTGSVAIDVWENGTINGVAALVTSVDTENWYFRSLFMNGQRLQVATWPQTGTFLVADARDADKMADSYEWGAHGAFYAYTDEILNFANLEDVYVRMSHWWIDQMMPIASVDTATGRVEVSRASSRTIQVGDRFVYENVREALTEPGQWYLDRSEGKLYYIPRTGETAENTVVYAPVNQEFLRMDGVSNIRFQGIRFENSDWDFFDGEGPSGNPEHPLYQNRKYNTGDYQANSSGPEAITVQNATGIEFVDCRLVNISHNCIQFGINTRNCLVDACLFQNIGGSSVVINGTSALPSTTGNITVSNCEVDGYGQVFNMAVGLHLMHGDHCTLVGNEIHDGRYSGISAGWDWGYHEQPTCNTQILNNVIYNVGVDGLLSDLGGVYLLGVQPNSVLSGNVIYNIDCYDEGYGATGIYLDQGSACWTVENNLVVDCATQCFTTAYGKDNTVRNNIFAFGNLRGFYVGQASDIGEDVCSLEFYKNIIVSHNKPMMEETIPLDWFDEHNNLLWDYSRSTVYSGLSTRFWERTGLTGMQKVGHFEDSVIADPLFADAQNREFVLAEHSPAFVTGFTPWETKAGSIYSFD